MECGSHGEAHLKILGLEHRVLERPSHSESVKDTIVVGAVYFNPFAQWLSNAVQVFDAIRALVAMLFFVCGPSTIRRLVIAIVINTIKGKSLGSRAHVGQEVLKPAVRISPAFANGYASAAVVRITRLIGLIAAAAHIDPYAICAAFRQTMCASAPTRGISHIATARFCLPRLEGVAANYGFGTADANAQPANRLVLGRRSQTDYAKSGKGAARQVNKVRAFLTIFSSSHMQHFTPL